MKPAQDAGAVIIADNHTTGTISNYLVGREDFIKEHPEIVTGVLQVLEKTKQWMDAHEKEAIQKYADLTGTDFETSKINYEARERSITIDDDKFADTIQQALDFSREQNLIDNKELTIDDIIDTSIFQKAGIVEKGNDTKQ